MKPGSSTRCAPRRPRGRVYSALLLVLQTVVASGAPIADAYLHDPPSAPLAGLRSEASPEAAPLHDGKYCQLCRVVRAGAPVAPGWKLADLGSHRHGAPLRPPVERPFRAPVTPPLGSRAPPVV